MNWDQIQGNWTHVKGRIKERWNALTEDDLHRIGGRRDQLVSRIQERYDIARDAAERQVAEWVRALQWDERRRNGMDANRETLKAWLRDAHAMERATADNLERQLRRLNAYPQLREKMGEHLMHSRGHVRRLEACLQRLGAEPSRVKDMATRMTGIAEIWAAGAAADEVVKNCIATYAFEQFEIACYASLAAAAEACGEPEIRRTCEEILAEESAIAHWLREHLPAVTREHLERVAAGETGTGVTRLGTAIREHPVPAALAAASVGLLVAAGSRAIMRRSNQRG